MLQSSQANINKRELVEADVVILSASTSRSLFIVFSKVARLGFQIDSGHLYSVTHKDSTLCI